MWLTWLIISFILFCTATVSFLFMMGIRYRRKRILTPFRVIFGGVFLSAVSLFLPVYFNYFSDFEGIDKVGKTIAASIQHSFRLFALDGEYVGFMDDILKPIAALTELDLLNFYTALCTMLYLIAPILTFTFLLSFFKNAFAHVRYRCVPFWKTTHVFSELNDKTLALAKSIMEKDDKSFKSFRTIKKFFLGSIIVFTDVIEENDESSYELLEEAKELGAILFRKDLDSVKLIRFNRHRKIKIYLISENESEKIRHATTVMTQYDFPEVELYVFSENIQSRLVLGVKNIKEMKVVRVNDIQNLIYHNLDTYGQRLFDNAKAQNRTDADSVISAIVVGFGRYGHELVKALSWFCQYPGFELLVDIFDSNPGAEDSFRTVCPEMMKRSDKKVCGEANYTFNFHSGIDINSSEFQRQFNKIKNPTYIFVCLGNDSDNIGAAINIRTLCEKRGISPDIETVVYDSNIEQLMGCKWAPDVNPEISGEARETALAAKAAVDADCGGVTNHKNQRYKIHIIGSLDSFYSCDTVIESRWEKEGEEVNRRYYYENVLNKNCDEKPKNGTSKKVLSEEKKKADAMLAEVDRQFWQYEYNYGSSVTKAIHERLKKKLHATDYGMVLPYINKPRCEWTDEEKLAYSELEHPRWNAYMRSEGYSYGEKRNDLAKLHNNLVPTEELDKETRIKDF